MERRLFLLLIFLGGLQSTCIGAEVFKCSIDYFQLIEKDKGTSKMSSLLLNSQYDTYYFISIDREDAKVGIKASTTPAMNRTFAIIGTKYEDNSIIYELLDEDQMPLTLKICQGIGKYPRFNLTFGPVLQVFGKHEPYDNEFRKSIYSINAETFVSFMCFFEDYTDE